MEKYWNYPLRNLLIVEAPQLKTFTNLHIEQGLETI